MDNKMQCTMRERERVKRQWIKRKQQDMFRGSSHCSTFPPSHRRIFTKSYTQDFPHRESPLRIWVIQIGSIQLLFQPIQPLHKRQGTTQFTCTLRGIGTQPNKNQPLTRGIRLKANTSTITSTLRGIPITTSTITSHQRDINTITSHQRDITKYGRFYNSWWFQ